MGARTDIIKTEHGVTWGDADSSVRISLIGKDSRVLALGVISQEPLEFFYRTRINSNQEVIKRLELVSSPGSGEKTCEIDHSFNKTTVWMAIEVKREGKRVEDLCRTFYGSLDKAVPRDGYWE